MRLEGRPTKGSTSPPHSLSNGSNGSSNGHSPTSLVKAINGHARQESLAALPATLKQSNGTAPVTAAPHKLLPKTWSGHDREEVARILIQGLTELGYHSSAKALIRESGFELDGPNVAAFRSAVLDGRWDEAEELLFGDDDSHLPRTARLVDQTRRNSWGHRGLTLIEGANKREMTFWIRQQKYLEHLERRDLQQALHVLRQELTPLQQDQDRLHQLAGYAVAPVQMASIDADPHRLLMCSPSTLQQQAQWDGSNGQSRHDLLTELSSAFTSPNS
jgi:hypothetical protein